MERPARVSGCNPIHNLWDDIKNEADKKLKEHLSAGFVTHISTGLGQLGSTAVNMSKRCLEVTKKDDGPIALNSLLPY